jgi:cytochrome P450 monooxygenase-1
MAGITYLKSKTSKDSAKFPIINPPSNLDIAGRQRREDFAHNGEAYFTKGTDLFPEKPFRVMADHGELNVLPAKWADNLRNEPNLHFMKTIHEDFHADYAAFKPFAAGTADDALLQAVARKQLTKYLSKSSLGLQ